MLIRPAESADFEAIAALTNHYIVHTAVHFGYEPQTAADLREAWEKSRAVFPFVIGEVDGKFAGFAKAYSWRARQAYEKTCEVGIYIQHGFQGKGYGKQLYKGLLDACRSYGFHTAVGGIALPNDASCRLHEACGFQYTGVFRQVGWKFERWHDVAFYQIML
jgi:L-amino acid N-acyltransferase YncA